MKYLTVELSDFQNDSTVPITPAGNLRSASATPSAKPSTSTASCTDTQAGPSNAVSPTSIFAF